MNPFCLWLTLEHIVIHTRLWWSVLQHKDPLSLQSQALSTEETKTLRTEHLQEHIQKGGAREDHMFLTAICCPCSCAFYFTHICSVRYYISRFLCMCVVSGMHVVCVVRWVFVCVVYVWGCGVDGCVYWGRALRLRRGFVTESLASGFPRFRWSKISLSMQLQHKRWLGAVPRSELFLAMMRHDFALFPNITDGSRIPLGTATTAKDSPLSRSHHLIFPLNKSWRISRPLRLFEHFVIFSKI